MDYAVKSTALTSRAGQTALPGGKVDEEDGDVLDSCESRPPIHPSISTVLVSACLPISSGCEANEEVAFLDDESILDGLRAAQGEVAHIFDHPLEALLDPELARGEKLVSIGSEDWPCEAGLYVSPRRFLRPHACASKNSFFVVSSVGGLIELHGQRPGWARRTACIVFGALPL